MKRKKREEKGLLTMDYEQITSHGLLMTAQQSCATEAGFVSHMLIGHCMNDFNEQYNYL